MYNPFTSGHGEDSTKWCKRLDCLNLGDMVVVPEPAVPPLSFALRQDYLYAAWSGWCGRPKSCFHQEDLRRNTVKTYCKGIQLANRITKIPLIILNRTHVKRILSVIKLSHFICITVSFGIS